MNENKMGATVNHEDGNNDTAAYQTTAAGKYTTFDLFGDSDSDDTAPAQGMSTVATVSSGNGAAKAAVQRKRRRKTKCNCHHPNSMGVTPHQNQPSSCNHLNYNEPCSPPPRTCSGTRRKSKRGSTAPITKPAPTSINTI